MPGFSLLLVDDELPLLGLLKKYLEREGYSVETAADGRKALVLTQSRNFDLIVLDLNLPDIHGEELMLKLMGSCPACRFLICSGIPYGTDHLPETARPRVATLMKPFMPAQLSKALKSLLNQGRAASV
jgi:DNA-binding response OmpR family regulator